MCLLLNDCPYVISYYLVFPYENHLPPLHSNPINAMTSANGYNQFVHKYAIFWGFSKNLPVIATLRILLLFTPNALEYFEVLLFALSLLSLAILLGLYNLL